MKISKKSEYAILGVLFLACQPENHYLSIHEITRKQPIPAKLLLKLFNTLVQAQILESKSGIGGGFRLKKSAEQITLLDILHLFESSSYLNACVGAPCGQGGKCSLANVWKTIQQKIDLIFGEITFQELAKAAIKNPSTFLNK